MLPLLNCTFPPGKLVLLMITADGLGALLSPAWLVSKLAVLSGVGTQSGEVADTTGQEACTVGIKREKLDMKEENGGRLWLVFG